MNNKFEELLGRLGEYDDLQRAAAVLRWDQQTNMPAAGATARAQQLGTLTRMAHERLVAEELGRLLDSLESELAGADYDSYEASLLRVVRRRHERELKLPGPLVGALAQATSRAHTAWQQARAESDFCQFEPVLAEIVELTLEKAEALGYTDHPYDALLDLFEPGMKTAEVKTLFAEMKAALVPLAEAIARRHGAVDDSVLGQDFPVDGQWEFGLEVIERIGFDLKRGRQDRSAHPFTTSFSIDDVRLTTRLSPERFKTAIFASIHEAGHGTYEQGYPPAFARTLLSSSASSGVHESQSRLWENMVGRSRDFWGFWLPRLRAHFPVQLEGVSAEHFYRAVNRVSPSFIRVEADEVTYNLHIFLRFEIELLLLEGKVAIADLPELWNSKMLEYLGIQPPSDALGVLQDVHWSSGYIGYFPTYSLGNLLAAQFYSAALVEVPEIPAQLAAGRYSTLLDWMQRNIHRQGAKYTPVELVARITGGPIRTGPFLDYVQAKYTDIYDL